MRREEGRHPGQKRTGVGIGNLSLIVEGYDGDTKTPLSLEVAVVNQGHAAVTALVLRATVQDPEGRTLGSGQSKLNALIDSLPGGQERLVVLSLVVPAPRIDTLKMAELYQVQLTVEDSQGEVLDSLEQSFVFHQFPCGRYSVKPMGQSITMVPNHEERHAFWIANQFHYISLDRFEPHWELQEDGCTIAQGKLAPMSVAPGQSVKLSLPAVAIDFKPSFRYEWILRFRPLAKTLWGPAEQSVRSGRLYVQ